MKVLFSVSILAIKANLPGDLLDSGVEPASVLAGGFFTPEPPGKLKKDKICGINILSLMI